MLPTTSLFDDLPPGLSRATPRPDDDSGRATVPRHDLARSAGVTQHVAELELHSRATLPTLAAPLPQIPGYEVTGVLGGGGMGVVYRASDIQLKRPVAIKMIAADHGGAATRQRFQTEAETVARLRHPNVVQIYEIGECDGRPFLALELVEGGTLAGHLANHGPLAAPDAARLLAAIARAIDYAHHQGVVHRDLKPSNVLLQIAPGLPGGLTEFPPGKPGGLTEFPPGKPGGLNDIPSTSPALHVPKIADFGLAKLLDSDQSRTKSGAILGTPFYMAPEQARSTGHEVGPLADVYAMGAMLFECLTGRPPFLGETSWEVLTQVVSVDAPPPSRFRPRLSRDLDTICLKCLEKSPARRYGSAASLADDLERFAAGEAISARPHGALRRIGRRLKRRPVALAIGMLLLGATLLAGGFWQLRRSRAVAILDEGRALARRGDHAAAAQRLKGEMDRVGRVPGCSDIYADLFRAWAAAELRHLTERLIFDYDPEHVSDADQRRLADQCERLWSARELILMYAAPADSAWEARVRDDLRDVALRGIELNLHLAANDEAWRTAYPIAVQRFDELLNFAGPSAALKLERDQLVGSIRPSGEAPEWRLAPSPRTAAERHQYGRALWRIGALAPAAEQFQAGLRINPQELALHFDAGRLQFAGGDCDGALASFTASLAIKPIPAAYSRRAFVYLARYDRLAWWQIPQREREASLAMLDFDSALERDPTFAESLFGRAETFWRLSRIAEARRDFEAAVAHGYPRERALMHLAASAVECGDTGDARRWLNELLSLRPDDRNARAMLDSLHRRQDRRLP